VPFARGDDDLSLLKPTRSATLASKPPERDERRFMRKVMTNVERPFPASSTPSPLPLPAPEADNGDFVDQLRNVHYLLVVACLALLVIANSQRDTSDTERAARDIVSLSNFTSDWNNNSSMTTIVEDHLRSLVRDRVLSPLAFPTSIYIRASNGSPQGINIELPRPPHTWMLSNRSSASDTDATITPGDILSPRTALSYPKGMRLHDWALPQILDLRDVIAVWNMLDDYPFLAGIDKINKVSLFNEENRYDVSVTVFCDDAMALPASCAKRESVDGLVTVPITNVSDGISGLSTIDLLKLQVGTRAIGDKGYTAFAKYVAGSLDGPHNGYCTYEIDFTLNDQKIPYILLMEAECNTRRYNWQKELWKYDVIQFGQYSVSFPQLATASEGLQDDRVDTVEKHLRALAEKTAPAFEIFGTKIPGEAVSLWGPLIIIGIGTYFFLDVAELRRRVKINDKAWTKAWLGIHSYTGSKLAMLISVEIFPPFTIVVCVLIPGIVSRQLFTVAAMRDGLLFLTSIVIAVATLWKWWGMIGL
jgi:hypothetical protein